MTHPPSAVASSRRTPTSRSSLRSIARQLHSSLARAIQPFNTRWDGDVLFAVSTQKVDNPKLDEVSLAIAASELAWDAALASFDP